MTRKIYKLLSSAKQGLFALALTIFWYTTYSQAIYNYSFTGGVQTLTINGGSYSIQCWGGDGGDGGTTTPSVGTGGKGGYSSGTYSTAGAATLYIYVGGKGQSNAT